MEDENVKQQKLKMNAGDIIVAFIISIIIYGLIWKLITGSFSPSFLDGPPILLLAVILAKPLSMFRIWTQGRKANAGESETQ